MSLDDIIKQSKQEQYEQRKKQLDDDLFKYFEILILCDI
jgi:hypothetical protein